jgi:hypothetical protein
MPNSRTPLLCLAVILPISFAAAQNDATNSDAASPLSRSNHVVVIMEENRSVDAARQYMPYLRSLADQYAQGLEVYSDSHGSWLAYGELTSGLAPHGGRGLNGICNGDGCTQTITIDNLVRHFAAQHKSWRGYFESMPTVGFLGYHFDLYYRRHNPFAFYSDLVYTLPQHSNLVPTWNHMLLDFHNNNLANFTWISPNVVHDADEGNDDQLGVPARRRRRVAGYLRREHPRGGQLLRRLSRPKQLWGTHLAGANRPPGEARLRFHHALHAGQPTAHVLRSAGTDKLPRGWRDFAGHVGVLPVTKRPPRIGIAI